MKRIHFSPVARADQPDVVEALRGRPIEWRLVDTRRQPSHAMIGSRAMMGCATVDANSAIDRSTSMGDQCIPKLSYGCVAYNRRFEVVHFLPHLGGSDVKKTAHQLHPRGEIL